MAVSGIEAPARRGVRTVVNVKIQLDSVPPTTAKRLIQARITAGLQNSQLLPEIEYRV